MDPTEIMFAAAELGVCLFVTQDDRIAYRPKSRMTPELLAEIKANKQALIFDVLLADALRYIAGRCVQGSELPSLDDAQADRLEEAYNAGDLEAYHEAIRVFVRAALREIARAKAPPARRRGAA